MSSKNKATAKNFTKKGKVTKQSQPKKQKAVLLFRAGQPTPEGLEYQASKRHTQLTTFISEYFNLYEEDLYNMAVSAAATPTEAEQIVEQTFLKAQLNLIESRQKPTKEQVFEIADSEINRYVKQNEKHEFLTAQFSNYRGLIYHIAYEELKNKEDAEEILQNTFLQAYREIDTLTSRGAFYTWLKNIAKNEIRQYKRLIEYKHIIKRSRSIDNYTQDGDYYSLRDIPDPSMLLDERFIIEEALKNTFRTIDGLNEEDKLVMYGSLVGESYESMAERLGKSRGAVASKLYHLNVEFKERQFSIMSGTYRKGTKKRTGPNS